MSLVWTAYKFTNKTGVSGTFKDFSLQKKNVFGSIENILNALKLEIQTASIDSKNTIRDFKLDTYFFKTFNTQAIKGTIIKAKDNEGLIKLHMNEKSHKVPFTYALKNDTIILFTHLDLNHWNAEEALNMLNKECYDLHKGSDGVSKLWPDVDVKIKFPINNIK